MAKTSTHKLVRIKPSNNRERHVAFGVSITKTGGWHRVPASVATQLASERMNDLNPDASPFVFDVKDETEAKEMALQESAVADPAGTVDRPREVAVVGPAAQAPAPAKGKRGKAAAPAEEGAEA